MIERYSGVAPPGVDLDFALLAFRYQDLDDVWREKYTGETVRSEARRFRDVFLTKLRVGDLPSKKAEQTVEQATTRWVKHHAARLVVDQGPKERAIAVDPTH